MDKLKIVRKFTLKDEWQIELYKRYPKLFNQHNKSMQETCMCWGIAVGVGWFSIIELLCAAIQNYIDSHKINQIEFTQIKEKFGILRIYTNYHEDSIQKLINMTEILSEKICENCGSVINVTTKGAYILTLCKNCRDKKV